MPNREIKGILVETINVNWINWSRKLVYALWVYKNSLKTPTNMSPFQLVIGKFDIYRLSLIIRRCGPWRPWTWIVGIHQEIDFTNSMQWKSFGCDLMRFQPVIRTKWRSGMTPRSVSESLKSMILCCFITPIWDFYRVKSSQNCRVCSKLVLILALCHASNPIKMDRHPIP